MRKPLMVGNWKMNLTQAEAGRLAERLKSSCGQMEGIDIAVAPAATSLVTVIQVLSGSRIAVAAQNCHWEPSGAFTGELSAEMIREVGCDQVIVGHSERRQYFAETDQTVNQKLKAAHRAGLLPIVCVGETLAEREAGKTMEVVGRQLKEALSSLATEQVRLTTVAYEPVWAIGTGKTATSQQAQQVHGYLREQLRVLVGSEVAKQLRILYGGSVKPSNIQELMAQNDVDGALVGGASLHAESFMGILSYRS